MNGQDKNRFLDVLSLGAEIRCVISVLMLNEGWDAQNVTQILGLRAFRLQLLYQQVVGRGCEDQIMMIFQYLNMLMSTGFLSKLFL